MPFDDNDDAAVSPFAAAITAQGLGQLRQRLEGLGASAAAGFFAGGISRAIFTPSAPTNTPSAGTNRQNAASSTQSEPSTTSSSSTTTSYSSSASSSSTSSSATPASVLMASVSSTGTGRVSEGAASTGRVSEGGASTGTSMPLPAGIAAFVFPGSAGGPQAAYAWQQVHSCVCVCGCVDVCACACAYCLV